MVDTALAWIGAIGGVIGVGGFITGAISLKIASRANEIAEGAADSEEISAEASQRAVTEAEQANRIAQQANDQAADANRIADAALVIAKDNSQVQWDFKIDERGLVVGVGNDSADAAENVTVVIDCEGEREADVRAEHVPGFGVVPLDLTGMWEKQFAQVRSKKSGVAISVPGGSTYRRRKSGSYRVRASVYWESVTGAPHSCVCEEEFTHRLKDDGTFVTNQPPEPRIF